MNKKVLDETPPWAFPPTTAVVPLDKKQNLHLPECSVVSSLLCSAQSLGEITGKICEERIPTRDWPQKGKVVS